MPEVTVSSIATEAGWAPGGPTTESVEDAAGHFAGAFRAALELATARSARIRAEGQRIPVGV
ncbi:MAG: hypothetical protein H0W07_06870 [Chloroflexi bacterium]|nr:hypothetical protein [Chloroflexota bacterium]